VPTLVLTGESSLDHVVPVDATSAYAALIAGARRVTLERTGHLGFLTRPEAFTGAIAAFLASLGLLEHGQAHMPEHAA
jgi:pimeloyl-ACP methyl ester carboxylesterase